MRHALYAGTFDPFTKGHEDILRRSLKLFDTVTIVLAVSMTKKTLFSRDERKLMIEQCFSDEASIKVDSWDGLIVDYARINKIQTIIRGLRPTGDFEMEFQMASMNNHLNRDVETVFLTTAGDHYFVSSTLVREVFYHGGDISAFVPAVIHDFMIKSKASGTAV